MGANQIFKSDFWLCDTTDPTDPTGVYRQENALNLTKHTLWVRIYAY